MKSQQNLFRFYDSHVNGEELRGICREKLRQFMARVEAARLKKLSSIQPPTIAKLRPALTPSIALSSTQISILKRAIEMRSRRKDIEIMVVEDQDFSRQLLQGALEKQYTCHGAKNAEEAIEIFTLTAPDICFLDIELPGISGHQLAELIRNNDPEAHIIIVSGNNYPKDVEIAKRNQVQGFIAKPYEKQKIFSLIDRFLQKRVEMESV